MPLSDHEQRLLEQMERVLAAEDPKLASALRGSSARSRQRRLMVLAGVGFVVGLIMMFTGVVVPAISGNLVTLVAVSGPGFLLMLASTYYVAVNLRQSPSVPDTPSGVTRIGPGGRTTRSRQRGRGPRPAAAGSGRASFMARMEERWRRRREGGI